MKIKSAAIWFSAFMAIFAGLAIYVFWGAWGLDACPYMPDSQMVFPDKSAATVFIKEWIRTGKFVPYDLRHFIGSGYLWQEMQYVLGVFCSALGVAYYMRGRGLSRLAAYASGLLLAFCGYWLTLFSAGHSGWFLWMMPGVFAFGLLDRAIRKNKTKNWVLLGACVAWAGFYQPDLWLLFTLFTCAYGAWCCVRERKMPPWRGVLTAAIVFAVIGSPSVINAVGEKAGRERQIEESRGTALSGGKSASDDEARWAFVTNWSLPPKEIAEFFISRINGDTSCQAVLALGSRQGTGVKPYTGELGRPYKANSGNYRQHSLYVGLVTCLLALAGLIFAVHSAVRRRCPLDLSNSREVVFFAVAALIFCLLSTGRYFEPLYRLVFSLPIGDSIRAPVKWHHLTEFCLCVMAGYGIDFIRKKLLSAGFKTAVAECILVAVSLYGVIDLAVCARRYCAVVDLSVVRNENPAAELVKRRGGGKVADLIEGGHGLVSWSFTTRGVEMVQNPLDKDTRFVWVAADMLKSPNLRGFLERGKAMLVGTYRVDEKAVRTAQRDNANAYMYELSCAAPPVKGESKYPPFTVVTLLGAISLVSSVLAAAYGINKS